MMRFVILIALCYQVRALFEDQVGKFDWRRQYVGCPNQVIFDRAEKADRLLMSTKENVFTSICMNTGQIKWRRIQEASDAALPMVSDDRNLYTVSDNGRVVRVWNKRSGALRWQKPISEKPALSEPRILLTEKLIVTLNNGRVSAFSKVGKEMWIAELGISSWSTLLSGLNKLFYLSIIDDTVTVHEILNESGQISRAKSVNMRTNNGKQCLALGTSLFCAHNDVLYSIKLTDDELIVKKEAIGIYISEISLLDETHFTVKTMDATLIFCLINGVLKQNLQIDHQVNAISIISSENLIVAMSAANIEIYDLKSGKHILKSLLLSDSSAPVSVIYASSINSEIEVLIVGSDCRLELFVIDLFKGNISFEWAREEALSRISNVEMVDLPLSESQQMIEDEFEEEGDGLLSSFIRRVISQISQFQKWLFNTINQIFTVSNLITMRTSSFAELLDHIRNSAKNTNGRGMSLERDFFNLRKMIVVTSLDGVVFGLDSSDGSVIWRLWLGNGVIPLSNGFGEIKIPLFVQRSTAHYQLSGQAVVAFKDSESSFGVLILFNPITGVIVERKQLSSAIVRIDILPFVGKDHIHSLLIVEENEKISLHPSLSNEILSSATPVYILNIEENGVSGAKINLLERKLERLWTVNLHLTPSEKIVAIKGKSNQQRVHSQGRVLIDRNVQYKYSNPNLVAIASLDEVNQLLTIFLLDVVSGQIIHTAKLSKAAAPLHIVHCENWLAYSYWSEKGRRTEIGVLELYEGEDQSNKDLFDSLTPTKRAPEVVVQSFIYAQGIQAMAVSETEQGLTTRSIVTALPFGGIHEITRKILDATRPLEVTQEMREEMIIPYMPEIPIATEDMVNYNQTVHGIRGIKTAPSGLESTSLMLAYGTDLFFTRLNPSGTFDILKDDFDHVLISLVLFGLIAGSIITKKLARNNALTAAWA